jgi:hypothetical protein
MHILLNYIFININLTEPLNTLWSGWSFMELVIHRRMPIFVLFSLLQYDHFTAHNGVWLLKPLLKAIYLSQRPQESLLYSMSCSNLLLSHISKNIKGLYPDWYNFFISQIDQSKLDNYILYLLYTHNLIENVDPEIKKLSFPTPSLLENVASKIEEFPDDNLSILYNDFPNVRYRNSNKEKIEEILRSNSSFAFNKKLSDHTLRVWDNLVRNDPEYNPNDHYSLRWKHLVRNYPEWRYAK